VACKDEDDRLSQEEHEDLEGQGVKYLTSTRSTLKDELFERIKVTMPEFARMEQLFPPALTDTALSRLSSFSHRDDH
jgi:hypothetical protein